MKISVIIPTIGREDDLEDLFESIAIQTKKPLEIIIIDQSDTSETRDLCKKWFTRLPLRYYFFNIKSAAISRNDGVRKSKGDIIALLDDDTKIEADYFYQIEKFYTLYPHAIGAMGKIINQRSIIDNFAGKSILKKIALVIGVAFGLHSFEKKFKVLKSGHNLIPMGLNGPSPAEWLNGCAWYKKEIFNEFQFEEKFNKWAFCEDVLLSHQIYQKYPESLYYFPEARLYHFESSQNRLIGEKKLS